MEIMIRRHRLCLHDLIRTLVFLILGQTCQVAAQAMGRCGYCRYGSDYCDFDNGCVFGCEVGFHGDNCTLPCSIQNCLECVRQSNTMEACIMCKGNVYGPLCNIRCSRNCRGIASSTRSTCDTQGKCIYGCESGYHGDKCNEIICNYPNCKTCGVDWRGHVFCERCSAGYYWHVDHGCVRCSEMCSTPYDCHPHNGVCNNGCRPGMFGDQCNMHCIIANCDTCYSRNGQLDILCSNCNTGYHPEANQKQCIPCSSECIGCDTATGVCTSCQDGLFGDRCQYSCNIPGCNKCTFERNVRKASCLECAEGYFSDFDEHNHVNICQNCSDSCEARKCSKITGNCFNCTTGYYGRVAYVKGDSCRFKCSEHCVSNACDQDSGACQCKPGWYGATCTRNCPLRCSTCVGFVNGKCPGCDSGYYGDTCDKPCPSTCESRSVGTGLAPCDQDSGHCDHYCMSGYYGHWCNETCSVHCDGGSCNRYTGKCDAGCTPYWYGYKCDQKCSSNCIADSITSINRPCDMATGRCLQGCINNYYGNKCNSRCNYKCREQICFQDTGSCKYGCMRGYTGVNCSIQCSPNCPEECENCVDRYCDGDTKNCLQGCVTGFYGQKCQNNCSPRCLNRNCDENTGSCYECVKGYYGPLCTLECSSTCLDKRCYQDSGHCGQCEQGFYGDRCENRCQKNCHDKSCQQQNGECENGCMAGYFGKLCTTDCYDGWYGENCINRCGHCRDGTPCVKTSGRCISGCDVGYGGETCSYALSQSGPVVYDKEHVAMIAGVSVSAILAVFIGASVAIFCYCRSRRAKMAKREEPSVVFTTSHNSLQVIQSGTSILQTESDVSLHQVESHLLGTMEPEIRCTGIVSHRDYYILHRGTVLKRGEREDAYVKVLLLNDSAEKQTHLTWLKKEVEILELCSSHSNIISLLTMEQKPERFSVALSSCMQNNLIPYLHEINHSDDEDVEHFYHHQLIQFAIDVSDALHYLHRQQIIHRYLRARSIYLSDNLVAKLGDFDFAILDDVEEEEGSTPESSRRRDLPGTYSCWLAPEALISNRFSTQSDIWSYGILLWEIFTLGQYPYDRLEGNKLERAIVDGQRPPKPGLASVSMYRLMKNCWRYSPEDRPTAGSVLCGLTETQV